MDPTRRFSDRVDNYVRYRPRYPDTVVTLLREEAGLHRDSVVADVGSGTGIFSELFLRNGNPVIAVEPNREMRLASARAPHRSKGVRPSRAVSHIGRAASLSS